MIRRLSDDSTKKSAIQVKGLGSGTTTPGYITLAGFLLDYHVEPGLYAVELTEHEGSRAAIINLREKVDK